MDIHGASTRTSTDDSVFPGLGEVAAPANGAARQSGSVASALEEKKDDGMSQVTVTDSSKKAPILGGVIVQSPVGGQEASAMEKDPIRSQTSSLTTPRYDQHTVLRRNNIYTAPAAGGLVLPTFSAQPMSQQIKKPTDVVFASNEDGYVMVTQYLHRTQAWACLKTREALPAIIILNRVYELLALFHEKESQALNKELTSLATVGDEEVWFAFHAWAQGITGRGIRASTLFKVLLDSLRMEFAIPEETDFRLSDSESPESSNAGASNSRSAFSAAYANALKAAPTNRAAVSKSTAEPASGDVGGKLAIVGQVENPTKSGTPAENLVASMEALPAKRSYVEAATQLVRQEIKPHTAAVLPSRVGLQVDSVDAVPRWGSLYSSEQDPSISETLTLSPLWSYPAASRVIEYSPFGGPDKRGEKIGTFVRATLTKLRPFDKEDPSTIDLGQMVDIISQAIAGQDLENRIGNYERLLVTKIVLHEWVLQTARSNPRTLSRLHQRLVNEQRPDPAISCAKYVMAAFEVLVREMNVSRSQVENLRQHKGDPFRSFAQLLQHWNAVQVQPQDVLRDSQLVTFFSRGLFSRHVRLQVDTKRSTYQNYQQLNMLPSDPRYHEYLQLQKAFDTELISLADYLTATFPRAVQETWELEEEKLRSVERPLSRPYGTHPAAAVAAVSGDSTSNDDAQVMAALHPANDQRVNDQRANEQFPYFQEREERRRLRAEREAKMAEAALKYDYVDGHFVEALRLGKLKSLAKTTFMLNGTQRTLELITPQAPDMNMLVLWVDMIANKQFRPVTENIPFGTFFAPCCGKLVPFERRFADQHGCKPLHPSAGRRDRYRARPGFRGRGGGYGGGYGRDREVRPPTGNTALPPTNA
jgi:hypothetical protein